MDNLNNPKAIEFKEWFIANQGTIAANTHMQINIISGQYLIFSKLDTCYYDLAKKDMHFGICHKMSRSILNHFEYYNALAVLASIINIRNYDAITPTAIQFDKALNDLSCGKFYQQSLLERVRLLQRVAYKIQTCSAEDHYNMLIDLLYRKNTFIVLPTIPLHYLNYTFTLLNAIGYEPEN